MDVYFAGMSGRVGTDLDVGGGCELGGTRGVISSSSSSS